MGVCNCYLFCCTLLCVRSSIAIILMGKRELVALLNLSSWCLVMVERLYLAVPQDCLRFVIVVFPDHTHLLFLTVEIPLLRYLVVSELRVKLVPLNMFKPASIFLTDRSTTVILLWIIFVICFLCLSLLYYLVCSLHPCDYLLRKG